MVIYTYEYDVSSGTFGDYSGFPIFYSNGSSDSTEDDGSDTTIHTLVSPSASTEHIDMATTDIIQNNENVSWGIVAPALILFLAGLCGSISSLILLVRLKKSLTIITHWYIFHVIVSNCLLSLSLPIIVVEEHLRLDNVVNNYLCAAKKTILFLNFFSCTFFFCFMSIDRYLSSSHQLTFLSARLQSRKFAYVSTFTAWILSILFSIPASVHQHSGTWTTIFLSYFSAIYVIAFVVTCFFFVIALRVTFTRNQDEAKNVSVSTTSENVKEKPITWVKKDENTTDERRLTLTSALMVCYFFVSWLLLFSYGLRWSTEGENSALLYCKNSTSSIEVAAEFLIYACAAFNPYIYLASRMQQKPSPETQEELAA